MSSLAAGLVEGRIAKKDIDLGTARISKVMQKHKIVFGTTAKQGVVTVNLPYTNQDMYGPINTAVGELGKMGFHKVTYRMKPTLAKPKNLPGAIDVEL